MIVHKKFIRREDLRNNPDMHFVFGDNSMRIGLGGQAREMRGEPNAIGITTKKKPSMTPDSFFSDEDFDYWLKENEAAFEKIASLCFLKKFVIVPLDGIGTGLAQLEFKAPNIFAYINEKLSQRFE